MKSHAAAKRRSARRDGAESFAGVEVRAALIATSARATLRRHDSLVEGVWIRTIGPPVTCELCWRGLPLLPARERERLSAISPARRAIPSSLAAIRFGRVAVCDAARPSHGRGVAGRPRRHRQPRNCAAVGAQIWPAIRLKAEDSRATKLSPDEQREVRFALDSLLEEAGFELFVPLGISDSLRAGGAVRGKALTRQVEPCPETAAERPDLPHRRH